MTTRAYRFEDNIVYPDDAGRIYTACIFDPDAIVPRVHLLAAATDEEAIARLRSSGTFKTRELWDRHRLVATFRAKD